MSIVYYLLPGFSNGNREISQLTSLTLIPYGNPALSVAWTLSFELCFYLLFSFSFFSKRTWNCFVFLWFLGIIIFNYYAFSSLLFLKNSLFRIVISPYNFEFILGFVFALLVVQKIRLPIIPVFSVLLLALMSFFYCIFTHLKLFAFDVNLLFAIVAFLSIFIVTSVRNFKINKESVLMLVGNATYSIYIIHNPLQMILTRFFPKINSIVSVIVALVLALIFSCVLGFGYYLVFKKKAIHLIKSKLIK